MLLLDPLFASQCSSIVHCVQQRNSLCGISGTPVLHSHSVPGTACRVLSCVGHDTVVRVHMECLYICYRNKMSFARHKGTKQSIEAGFQDSPIPAGVGGHQHEQTPCFVTSITLVQQPGKVPLSIGPVI